MNKTLKKTLSLILAILMIATTMPFALAAESDGVKTTLDVSKGNIVIADSYVTLGNETVVVDPDGYIVTGTTWGDTPLKFINDSGLSITFDLVFDNLSLTAYDWCSVIAIEDNSPVTLNIVCEGSNAITSYNHSIFNNAYARTSITINITKTEGSSFTFKRQHTPEDGILFNKDDTNTFVYINGNQLGAIQCYVHKNIDGIQYCIGYLCDDCGQSFGEAGDEHIDEDENALCDACDTFIGDEIKVGNTYTIDREKHVKFVPAVDGVFVLRSESNVDPVVFLLDSEFDDLDEADDSYYREDNSYDFYLEYEYKAGETYYFKFYGYDGEYNYSVIFECNEHQGGKATCNGRAVCSACGEEYGEVDVSNHNWANNDGICANGCGYECPHEKYTMGICDECNYLCPHSFTVFNETVAPKCEETGWEESYCDYCSIRLEQEVPALKHDWVSGGVERPSQNIDGSWSDGYYYDSCKNDGTHIKITGVAKRADYSAYDEAYKALKAEQKNEALTDEGAAAVNQAVMSGMTMPQNIIEDEPTTAYLNNWVKNAQSILAKIESGEYVKADGFTVYNERGREWLLKFNDDGVYEKASELMLNLTDEANAKLQEIYDFALSLEGNVAENAENIAKVEADIDEFFGQIENCIYDTHNVRQYNEIEAAKCGVNAVEEGSCWLCGEVLTREAEDTALTHSFTTYEEVEAPKCGVAGKEAATCDNGCGATDEKEIPALEHLFLEYTSNGDAICTADGTKTAECVLGCGATDTVADEGSMIDHADEDGDKICDDCQAEIVDTCPDCGRPVHEETGIPQYVCILIMLIRLVVSFIIAVK